MKRRAVDSDLLSLRHVFVGAAAGLAYAVLNNAMDYWHNQGVVARAFVALHDVVDDVIPVVVGALLGVAGLAPLGLGLPARDVPLEPVFSYDLRMRVAETRTPYDDYYSLDASPTARFSASPRATFFFLAPQRIATFPRPSTAKCRFLEPALL